MRITHWRMSRVLLCCTRALAWALLAVSVVASAAWCVGALLIAIPGSQAMRHALAAAVVAVALAALIVLPWRRWRWRLLGAYGVLFAGVLGWFFQLEPSNDRDWVAENARLAHATIDGNMVTVHNVRNFAYRSENDFTPAYYDKTLDLSRLEGVDLVASYWMGPAVAHIFLSFAFAGGDHLAVSIETRKEKGEGYSTVNGFFRQYELYYVVADERDVIGLRTNYRQDPPEQVYVYRIKGAGDGARRVFLDYIKSLNALKTQPEFYNSLTTNCTTTIWMHGLVNPGHVPFSWKILASGYVPEYLYENGRLNTEDLPFAELQRRAMVNTRAKQAGAAADFSSRIRLDSP
jgi:hypothetical protein